jgi:hypothetical protein
MTISIAENGKDQGNLYDTICYMVRCDRSIKHFRIWNYFRHLEVGAQCRTLRRDKPIQVMARLMIRNVHKLWIDWR